jgi:hypothetical protein
VEVKDEDNNTGKTLTVEFNVLPLSKSQTFPSTSTTLTVTPTESPTQQPTLVQTSETIPTSTLVIMDVIVSIVLVVLIIVGLIRYIVKSKKEVHMEPIANQIR